MTEAEPGRYQGQRCQCLCQQDSHRLRVSYSPAWVCIGFARQLSHSVRSQFSRLEKKTEVVVVVSSDGKTSSDCINSIQMSCKIVQLIHFFKTVSEHEKMDFFKNFNAFPSFSLSVPTATDDCNSFSAVTLFVIRPHCFSRLPLRWRRLLAF